MKSALFLLIFLYMNSGYCSDASKVNELSWEYLNIVFHKEGETSHHIPIKIERLLQRQYATLNGPNCWNAALYFIGALPHVRYTSAAEFDSFLRSPKFRKINPDEFLLPGDVVALYGANKHQHAFVYLSDDLFLHKNGPFAGESYQLTDISNVLMNFNPKLSKQSLDGLRKCPSLRFFRYNPLDRQAQNPQFQTAQEIFEKNEKKIEMASLGDNNLTIKDMFYIIDELMHLKCVMSNYFEFFNEHGCQIEIFILQIKSAISNVNALLALNMIELSFISGPSQRGIVKGLGHDRNGSFFSFGTEKGDNVVINFEILLSSFVDNNL